MVLNQQAGTLVPSPEGFVEISRPKPAKAVANEASAQSLQRRRKLKEMLETKLAKQFGASSNPHVRAVIRAEADRALAKGRLAPDDVRELERNIKKSLNMITSGTFEDKKVAADSAPEYAKARVDWNSVYKYKLRHGDDSEREKLERETAARQLLNRQIRHQIAEKESLKRKEEEEEAAAVRKQEDARRRAVEKAEEEKRAYRQKVQHELELNREQQRQVEQRKRDEAELARLEDEKMLHELRAAQEATKLKRAREAVAKAKRLELAKEENEKSRRIKAEAKAKEDDEVARLDALWTQMLDEQEAKRTEQMRKTHARQAQLQQAYGQTAGADMAERARRDEMSMLQAQKEYMEQQEARCAARRRTVAAARASRPCARRLGARARALTRRAPAPRPSPGPGLGRAQGTARQAQVR